VRAATLFSGIGAPEVAMPSWQWLWHAEIEPFPAAVMAARHPGSINLGDVTSPDFVERALDVGRPDVVVFGSPCQSFSVAGKRGGMADPRGNLALVGLEVVRRLGAPWFVWENVPGVLSGGFSAFIRAVEECGYLGCWRILDAQFAGVPQRRRRVFFVGHLGDWRPAAAVLFEPASLQGHPPPRRETGQIAARPITAGSPGGSGYRNDADTADNLIVAGIAPPITSNPYGDHESREGLLVAFGGNNTAGPVEIATAVNAHGGPHGRLDFESETFVTCFDARQSDVCLYGDRAAPLDTDGYTQAVAVPILEVGKRTTGKKASLKDGLGIGSPGDPMFTLQGGAQHAVASLKTGGGKPGQSYPAIAAPAMVRRLLPIECERLMGLPDNYTAIMYRGKPAADGNRYKACGNSMAVPCLAWILQRLERQHAAMAQDRAA
jgi:DNA (cytosine-5)-methyltransferase 1